MASWKQFFKGNLLSAKRLGSKVLKGKITEVETVTIKDKNDEDVIRLDISLDCCEEKMRLNKTNCESLSKAYGDDYTKWVGKTVQVKTGPQTFMGEKTIGLFITPQKK